MMTHLLREENIRYDASIGWDKKEIKGEKYAVLLYKRDYTNTIVNWGAIYSWIDQSDYTFRDEPPFEKYLNTPQDVSEDELLTKIYIPVE